MAVARLAALLAGSAIFSSAIHQAGSVARLVPHNDTWSLEHHLGGEAVVTRYFGDRAHGAAKVAAFGSVILKDYEFIENYVKDVYQQDFAEPWQVVIGSAEASLLDHFREMFLKHDRPGAQFEVLLVHFDKDPGLYGTWDVLVQDVSTAALVMNWNVDDRKRPDSTTRKVQYFRKHPEVDVVCSTVVAHQHLSASWPSADWTNEAAMESQGWWELWYANEEGTAEDISLQKMIYFDEDMDLEMPFNQPHNSPMWRRTLHSDAGVGSFAEGGNLPAKAEGSCSDWALWTRALVRGHKIVKLPDALELYLVRNDSYERRKEPKGSGEAEECYTQTLNYLHKCCLED